jgi:S1-C subfamily serine protease
MVIRPSARFNDADPWDRSGMWLRLTSGAQRAFEIADIAEHSPAAEAGLHVGDRVLAIDGASTQTASLIDTRTRIASLPNGARINMRVNSGGAERDVTLVLRDPPLPQARS